MVPSRTSLVIQESSMPATKRFLARRTDAGGNFSRNLPADFAERVRVNQATSRQNLKRITTSSSRLRLLWLGGGGGRLAENRGGRCATA